MANFAIFAWPLVSVVLFLALGRGRGIIWSVLVGFLLLPEAWVIDLPILPPYGKSESIALGLLLGALSTMPRAEPLPKVDPGARWLLTGLLVILLLISPIATVLTNRDAYILGEVVFPAIGWREIQGRVFYFLAAVVPFLLARRHLHSPEMHREILKAMVAMGVFYALLALYEIRMSPQLNVMLYGYFPHSFLQHMRGGGFRPLVFLLHGLELGFFLLTAVLAGIGLLRATAGQLRAVFLAATVLLFLVLAISRNLGALALCMVFAPTAILFAPKTHVRIAVVVVILFTAYPLTRQAYIEPLLAAAELVSAERYQSLEFRFIHEDALLERAFERPVAGWGTWGRWRVHNEFGQDITVSDGIWVIQLAGSGWIGFFGLFGLIMAPILLIWRNLRHCQPNAVTSVMVLMVAANLIYMIPNATLSPLGWLVAGALAGYVQFARSPDGKAVAPENRTEDRRKLHYTRFGTKKTM